MLSELGEPAELPGFFELKSPLKKLVPLPLSPKDGEELFALVLKPESGCGWKMLTSLRRLIGQQL